MEKIMTKQEFWKLKTPKYIRIWVLLGAVLCYVTAALTLVVAVSIGWAFLLDACIALTLGLGIQVKKSRICSVMIMAYYIGSKLLQYKVGFNGMNLAAIAMVVLFLIAYALCIYGTFQYQKLWKQYQDSLTAVSNETTAE